MTLVAGRSAQTAAARATRLVRLSAPVAAFLSSCLALCCLVNQRDVAVQLSELATRNPRFAGWVALGALLGVGAAAGCLLGATWVGPGPGMALATVTAVSGLTVAREALGGSGLATGLLLLEASAGGLLGAALGATFDLPRRSAVLTLAGWGIPLITVWPVLAWLQARGAPRTAEETAAQAEGAIPLTVYPPGWLLAAIALSLMAWSIVAMLVEPPARPSSRVRAYAWLLPLTGVVCGVLLVLGLVGMSPTISLDWLRPTIMVATVGIGLGWVLAVVAIGPGDVALAVTGVSVVGWSLPSLLSFALGVAATGPAGLDWWVMVVLAAAGVAGCWVGWQRARVVLPLALCVLVAAFAGAWVMSDRAWVVLFAAVPMVAAAGAVGAAGVRLAFVTPTRLAAVGLAAIAAVVSGLVLAVPLSWALVGDVPAGLDALRAGARVLVGLCGALSLVAAAYTAMLVSRLGSATPKDSPAVHLQDLAGRES